ncbi:MAG: NADH-quinone oxidoreductase subunit C [Nitrososphaerota archaeon]|nr:NADH-quinone oxidoreductase subunit C [Candidatus Bathyarchaeota archaeon]MDW8023537.1 NADH-quinone oxidoreductase subunit C [Nitrososphaerota archaeon]
MSEPAIVKKLKNLPPSHVIEVSVPRGERVFARVNKEHLKNVISFLVDEGFRHLAGITALETDEGFELLYHLSMEGTLLTVKVDLLSNDDAAPTITDIIQGALLYEREAHDLFGIKFEGNPYLKPLILPDDWPVDDYPLRKRGRRKGEETQSN